MQWNWPPIHVPSGLVWTQVPWHAWVENATGQMLYDSHESRAERAQTDWRVGGAAVQKPQKKGKVELGNKDSNLDKALQRRLCYRYTIPQECIANRSFAWLAVKIEGLEVSSVGHGSREFVWSYFLRNSCELRWIRWKLRLGTVGWRSSWPGLG
jgi:hypothetical protein